MVRVLQCRRTYIHILAAVGMLCVPLYRSYAALGLGNPIQQGSLYCFLQTVLEGFILILFPIVVLAMVYSGFLFVAAQGNPQKLKDARMWLIAVVVGALVILGAKVLAIAVEATVNDIYTSSGLGGSLVTGREACP